jgi:hypothetical protein
MTARERCEQLRWGFYDIADAMIQKVERDVIEKHFPGVPYHDETIDDYDYANPRYMACHEVYRAAVENDDRVAEASALKAAFDEAMREFERVYRPSFEARFAKALAAQ